MKRVKLFGLLIITLFYAGYSQNPAEGNVKTIAKSGEEIFDISTVTAESWSIMDADGNLLWTYNGDVPRRAASTTKIMSTLIVLKLAKKDPSVLNEIVTVSESAAKTRGSTAKLEPGDKVDLKTLLYAFMIPSGNDAGNAIAEHLNDRFTPPDLIQFPPPKQNYVNLEELIYHESLLRGPRANFVAEMNRTARELGMNNTYYVSAFGDGGDYALYTTTTNDLVKLGYEAYKYDLIRDIVKQKFYNYTVVQKDGSTRDIELENTNPLLHITPPEGVVYDGIKTGYTARAKACLVATGKMNGVRLFVAFTKSESKETRLTDAVKLFEVAWTKLEK